MRERKRRLYVVLLALAMFLAGFIYDAISERQSAPSNEPPPSVQSAVSGDPQKATDTLNRLVVKGRAPKTGYEREKFSDGWGELAGCSVRELVLQRDLVDTITAEDGCKVLKGTLNDPYTATSIPFTRGEATSQAVQIDHVVAVSDAWQKGAQQLTGEQRYDFYNDPLNLLAVDGPTNNKKSDSDAATWLPPNKDYRCRYVARQIAVKFKYQLWVTAAEQSAMQRVLELCPDQILPITES